MGAGDAGHGVGLLLLHRVGVLRTALLPLNVPLYVLPATAETSSQGRAGIRFGGALSSYASQPVTEAGMKSTTIRCSFCSSGYTQSMGIVSRRKAENYHPAHYPQQNREMSSRWSLNISHCHNPCDIGKMNCRARARLMAYLQARWQISVMSAPEKPLVYLTSRSKSTSGATGDLRSTLSNICSPKQT